jgi:hypothetical protein
VGSLSSETGSLGAEVVSLGSESFTCTDLPVPTLDRQVITRLRPIQLSNDQLYWPALRTRIDAERWQGRRSAPLVPSPTTSEGLCLLARSESHALGCLVDLLG